MEKSQGFEEKQVVIDGINVNYKIAGQGAPFLILHGWGRGSDSWAGIQEKLVQAGFRVFVPDLPGFGKTPPPPAAWGIKEYAEFALKFAEALKLNNFVLLGHSFGGQTAVRFVTAYPGRVQKLILAAPAVIRRNPTLSKKIVTILAKFGNAIFSFWLLRFLQPFLRGIFYRLFGISDGAYSKGIMKEIRSKIVREDLSHLLQKIEIPTLLLWGNKDVATPFEDSSVFQEKMPNVSLKIIAGADHSLHRRAPEEFARHVINFCSGNP